MRGCTVRFSGKSCTFLMKVRISILQGTSCKMATSPQRCNLLLDSARYCLDGAKCMGVVHFWTLGVPPHTRGPKMMISLITLLIKPCSSERRPFSDVWALLLHRHSAVLLHHSSFITHHSHHQRRRKLRASRLCSHIVSGEHLDHQRACQVAAHLDEEESHVYQGQDQQGQRPAQGKRKKY